MNLNVLIAGAGPVGLTMAAELARYGVSVRIVDKAPERTDKSKALVIWSRTMELMDRMGCTAQFIEAGQKATGANVTAGDKQLIHLTLGGVDSPYPFALMIPQCETERLMEQHLDTLGAKVERGVELTAFTQSASSVVSTLRHPDGREETIESTWLIGCDGAHSTVRHRLGMEFVGDTLTSDWMLADLELKGLTNAGEINIMWHADGVLAIFPITSERYRIIADLGPIQGTAEPRVPTLEEVQTVLDQRGTGGVQASSPIWLAGFRINERKVREYRDGRIFLAGDAAHIHSPAGGQGMNTGMQDACNLAWKLALVCRGTCTQEPLLESYSAERSAVGEQVLQNAGRMTSIGILRGGLKQSIRNHIASLVFGFAPVRELAANAITEISIGYPESPLTASNHRSAKGPKPGERVPIRGGESPVGAGKSPRFAVFAEESADASQLLSRYASLLEPNVRKPFHAEGMWLVRPDGYAAVATKRDGWSELETYLARLDQV